MDLDATRFSEFASLCDALGRKLRPLIMELLEARSLQVHSVDYRVKEWDSLAKKIKRKSAKYSSLGDVTDILGIRVVTYFRDDVERVSEVIENELRIDETNSSDKGRGLDPDRFGYTSLHYVASVSEPRARLSEYARYSDIRFEIQVRSILQHAWAEIEHDLGYKSKVEVPREVIRRFSRLASLLELADDEFVGTRDELQQYAESVEANMSSGESDLNLELNLDSLYAYISASELVESVDRQMAQAVNLPTRTTSHEFASGRLKELHRIGFHKVSEVDHSLREFGELLPRLARCWILGELPPGVNLADDSAGDDEVDSFPAGVSIFYLFLLLTGMKEPGEAAEILHDTNLRNSFVDNLSLIVADLLSKPAGQQF